MSKVYNMPENAIHSSNAAELLTRCHDWASRSDGVIDDDFAELFPYMSLCEYMPVKDFAPKILVVGKQSSQVDAFGDEWGNRAHSTGKTPLAGLEVLSAQGYCDAAHYGFHHSIVEYKEPGLELVFERYIRPARLHKGGPIKFFSYTGHIIGHHVQ